ELGFGRSVQAREVAGQAPAPDDVRQFVDRGAGNHVHVDIAMHLAEKIGGSRDKGAREHGIVHEPCVRLRQLLDAFVVDHAAEDMLLEMPKLEPPRDSAVDSLMLPYRLELGRMLAGIDLKVGVDLEADGLHDDTIEVQQKGRGTLWQRR